MDYLILLLLIPLLAVMALIFFNINKQNKETHDNKNIFIVCFNISKLLKDKKFVSDFFKLSS